VVKYNINRRERVASEILEPGDLVGVDFWGIKLANQHREGTREVNCTD
jgi:hypothetical protein